MQRLHAVYSRLRVSATLPTHCWLPFPAQGFEDKDVVLGGPTSALHCLVPRQFTQGAPASASLDTTIGYLRPVVIRTVESHCGVASLLHRWVRFPVEHNIRSPGCVLGRTGLVKGASLLCLICCLAPCLCTEIGITHCVSRFVQGCIRPSSLKPDEVQVIAHLLE